MTQVCTHGTPLAHCPEPAAHPIEVAAAIRRLQRRAAGRMSSSDLELFAPDEVDSR